MFWNLLISSKIKPISENASVKKGGTHIAESLLGLWTEDMEVSSKQHTDMQSAILNMLQTIHPLELFSPFCPR